MKKLVELGQTQFGLIARYQFTECLLTPRMADYRLESGVLERTRYRGVYRIAGAPQTWESGAMELLLSCGPGSALSHGTAAYLHGFDGFAKPEVLDVLVPRSYLLTAPPHRIHRTRGSKIHGVKFNGLFSTSVVRTLPDLGEELGGDAFEKALDSARRLHKNFEPWFAQFAEAKENAKRPGVSLIKRLLAERNSPLDSAFEVEMKQILLAEGFPLPTFGFTVFDERQPLIKLDGAYLNYAGRNTALHFDGFGSHSRRKQFERDARQRTRLSVLGWTQVIVTWKQRNDPHWKRDLRRALGL